MRSKDNEIIFKAEIQFKGSISDFKKLTKELHNIGIDNVMIDTVPLPDKPAKGLMIGTWPTPDRDITGIISNTVPIPDETVPIPDSTVPIPDKRGSGLIIGSWSVPKVGAKGLMIDTIPLPEKKFNGLLVGTWPIIGKNGRFGIIPMPEKGLSSDLEEDLIKDMDSLKINTDIYGGIRTPHIHKGDVIYFIDRNTFKKHVGRIALEIMEELTKGIEGMVTGTPVTM
ncbi:MAG: hypothetical protein ACFFD7_12200 [Candidatus Thorarchaeota archaeon]